MKKYLIFVLIFIISIGGYYFSKSLNKPNKTINNNLTNSLYKTKKIDFNINIKEKASVESSKEEIIKIIKNDIYKLEKFAIGQKIKNEFEFCTLKNWEKIKSKDAGSIINIKNTEEAIEITIADIKNLKINFKMDQEFSELLEVGQDVSFIYNEKEYNAKISFVSPILIKNEKDSENQYYTENTNNVPYNKLEATFINDGSVKINGEGMVKIVAVLKKSVLVVDKRCIYYDEKNQPYIKIVNDSNEIKSINAKLGKDNNNFIELIEPTLSENINLSMEE